MKMLKLDGSKPDARRLARCLIGSPNDDGMKLIGVDDESDNPFIVQWPDIHGCNGHAEETLPIDTLVFDPFAAMRDGVDVQIGDNSFGTIDGYSNSFRVMYREGDGRCCTWVKKEQISLDIEAACKLEGIEEIEI